MSWSHAVLGFTAGLVISMITSPVGVSGAVFLPPFQLNVLDVPNPQVTSTNLFQRGRRPRRPRRLRPAGLQVAPAALTGTFLSSITDAFAFVILAVNASGHSAPDWPLGIA